MGVRLYNPYTGRFLSTDPVVGGSANAYEYCYADPINCRDLDGRRAVYWHRGHVNIYFSQQETVKYVGIAITSGTVVLSSDRRLPSGHSRAGTTPDGYHRRCGCCCLYRNIGVCLVEEHQGR
jgi:hypothetical protein